MNDCFRYLTGSCPKVRKSSDCMLDKIYLSSGEYDDIVNIRKEPLCVDIENGGHRYVRQAPIKNLDRRIPVPKDTLDLYYSLCSDEKLHVKSLDEIHREKIVKQIYEEECERSSYRNNYSNKRAYNQKSLSNSEKKRRLLLSQPVVSSTAVVQNNSKPYYKPGVPPNTNTVCGVPAASQPVPPADSVFKRLGNKLCSDKSTAVKSFSQTSLAKNSHPTSNSKVLLSKAARSQSSEMRLPMNRSIVEMRADGILDESFEGHLFTSHNGVFNVQPQRNHLKNGNKVTLPSRSQEVGNFLSSSYSNTNGSVQYTRPVVTRNTQEYQSQMSSTLDNIKGEPMDYMVQLSESYDCDSSNECILWDDESELNEHITDAYSHVGY